MMLVYFHQKNMVILYYGILQYCFTDLLIMKPIVLFVSLEK